MAKKEKVLIANDNPFMLEIIADKLKAAGFDVSVDVSGKNLNKKIKKEKPSLLILDTPIGGDTDGETTLKSIREEFEPADLPVLLLTGAKDEKHYNKVANLGIHGYLIKPVADNDQIASMAVSILKNKSGMQTLKPKPKTEEGAAEPESDANPKAGKAEEKKDENKGYVSPFGQSHDGSGVPAKLKSKIEKSLKSPREELSIISLINDMVEYAYHARASDIHIDPFDDRVIARMRIDGILYDVFTFPKTIHSEIIARIKVLAGMRTDEHQAAQDGRFRTAIKEPPRQFDIRVSIVPTYYGENAVLRLLAEQSTIETIDDLAFTAKDKQKIRRAIKKPYGMILATGPTGSGKSTTLYTIIRELNTREVSIITIEDPVEYSIEGIDQIQVNSRTGLTFATGLRSILRQDPNIIMVGEIRDKETASIAVNAALTGHKLLSTLHTNDAATALPRLLDMDVEPFLVASTVNVIIGQRLVRMLCQHCKQKKKLTDQELATLKESVPAEIVDNHREFYEAKKCSQCGDTGYFDRMGIYEILEMNDEVRSAVLRRADAGEIRQIATKNGMTTLLEDGFKKAIDGLTTIEEILRVVKE